eukprot:3927136-Amphidinium_carterae.1
MVQGDWGFTTPGTRQVAPSRVSEGSPALKNFHATPLSTRRNSLTELTRCFNIRGIGCCSKHVAWTALLDVVSQEMSGRCVEQVFRSGWQCP